MIAYWLHDAWKLEIIYHVIHNPQNCFEKKNSNKKNAASSCPTAIAIIIKGPRRTDSNMPFSRADFEIDMLQGLKLRSMLLVLEGDWLYE
jgi:hypothetical protein